jgi:hypothetical protein
MPNAAMSVKRKLRISVVYEDLGKSWRRARHAPVGTRDRPFYLFGEKHRLALSPDH